MLNCRHPGLCAWMGRVRLGVLDTISGDSAGLPRSAPDEFQKSRFDRQAADFSLLEHPCLSILHLCFSAEDICPFSAADICPVAHICPVSTAHICLLSGHCEKVENDFDPFFTPKVRKMEQIRWSRCSRRSHGNDATGRAAAPYSTRAGGQDYVSS